jgi:hypothetical protein
VENMSADTSNVLGLIGQEAAEQMLEDFRPLLQYVVTPRQWARLVEQLGEIGSGQPDWANSVFISVGAQAQRVKVIKGPA